MMGPQFSFEIYTKENLIDKIGYILLANLCHLMVG